MYAYVVDMDPMGYITVNIYRLGSLVVHVVIMEYRI